MIILKPKDLKTLKSREIVTLECEQCHSIFYRNKNKVLTYIKRNQGKYCSKACQTVAQKTGQLVHCIECGKEVYKQKKILSGNIFCSHSCSAKHSNAKRYKDSNKKSPCICGKNKSYRAALCHTCKHLNNLNKALTRTLKNATSHGNARTKWAYVRKLAAKILQANNIEKKCYLCGFDLCLDVCHIKPISEFDENAFLSEVNSLENLIYLCPNHHKMLHKNMLSLLVRKEL